MKWKAYKKGQDVSYAFGAFPTIELIKNKPEMVVEILISEAFSEKDMLTEMIEKEAIKYEINDKAINRLSPKGNVFVIGVFKVGLEEIQDNNHIILDQISDMGNLGNICRTMLAMGLKDLVTIGNVCDIYNPKTVRASMGAIFYLRHKHYDTIQEYLKEYPFLDRRGFSFMLNKDSKKLPEVKVCDKWSLIFGNEGSGLPEEYREISEPVIIPQSSDVDSLNLTTAVAIGCYHFTNII